jgi:hypothetical protein
VVLKILVRESLDLELWLKRWGILKFQGLFCEFSGARDLSEIIFKFQGPNCEIVDIGLISEKTQ